jgi:predicted GNAT family acetyltransferase
VSFLVEDNPARRRFEILVDDALAGFTAYEPRGEVLVLTHTEVDPQFRDMGVGSALVRGTLDQIRERGGRLVPECPFVAAFMDRHPEYADLVAD